MERLAQLASWLNPLTSLISLFRFISRQANKRADKPYLGIWFEHNDGYCIEQTGQPFSGSGGTRKSYCYRFKVTNDGPTRAEKCEAKLMAISMSNPDRRPSKCKELHTPVKLKWAESGQGETGIGSGCEAYCNLIVIPEQTEQDRMKRNNKYIDSLAADGSLGLVIDYAGNKNQQINRLIKPPAGNTYLLDVTITDVKTDTTVSTTFKVQWKGSWKNNLHDMMEEAHVEIKDKRPGAAPR
ncbi:MAG: hypothetical protein HQK60_03215 [Deltaproteobacteria bacterium]|nr:hypothetical protein [Deltaproteobacteria bacterium]